MTIHQNRLLNWAKPDGTPFLHLERFDPTCGIICMSASRIYLCFPPSPTPTG